MLPCTPILATLGPRLTHAGIFANVAAVPFGEIVSLPLCLVHVVVPTGVVARGIALVASGALLVVRWLARTSAGATWLSVPIPPPGAWHFVVLGVGGTRPCDLERPGVYHEAARVVAWAADRDVRARRARRVSRRRTRAASLRVTVLDVGQGDSALVDLPGRQARARGRGRVRR